jgi:transposase
MGVVGFHFEPLAAHVLARIREGERIFADETTLPTLDPGAGKTKTAWLWAYARGDRTFGGVGPPMVSSVWAPISVPICRASSALQGLK